MVLSITGFASNTVWELGRIRQERLDITNVPRIDGVTAAAHSIARSPANLGMGAALIPRRPPTIINKSLLQSGQF
jgi:hypothetical protein